MRSGIRCCLRARSAAARRRREVKIAGHCGVYGIRRLLGILGNSATTGGRDPPCGDWEICIEFRRNLTSARLTALEFGVHLDHSEHDVPEEYLLGQYIPLHYHYNMLLDGERMTAFREAIEHMVRPGSKVLELGGGTGILSFLAAQRAEKVWCVERNPALVEAARQFLPLNEGGERVEVVQADALEYLPPEPVDAVICEMLHVGLLREKQVQVMHSFKERYRERFGNQLPVFLPDASLLGFQLVEHEFCFSGYHAPVPHFQPVALQATGSRPLADPVIYSTIYYEDSLPFHFCFQRSVLVNQSGELNALRFMTKHFVAFLLEQGRGVEWSGQYLVLPLAEPVRVQAGDEVRVTFSYAPGGTIEALAESLDCDRVPQEIELYRAA